MMFITGKYLTDNPNHIFVFGDNKLRYGTGGAAALRVYPNTYGFITKKYPSNNDDAFYRPNEYKPIFRSEMCSLIAEVNTYPNKLYLISQLGSGLANKYKIYDKIIRKELIELSDYENVKLLF